MKKYLNTLYLTTDGTYIHKQRETIIIEIEGEKAAQLPIHTIANIYCFGRVMVSPALMGFCGERGVGLAFFTWYGKFLARVQGAVSGNVLLRKAQYRTSEDPQAVLEIAKNSVGAKIHSSRTSLQRLLRNYPDHQNRENIEAVIQRKKQILHRIRDCCDIDSVRGYEGEGALQYFSVFDSCITKNKEYFYLAGRNRRPPRDAVNSLLSLFYTLITQDCVSACEGVGLDPAVGFLHRDRPGRNSLALDLCEEFRCYIADRLTLSLINRQQITPKDFIVSEVGAYSLKGDARKTVLAAYQDRKKEEVIHPFLKEKAPLGLFFHLQAQLMSRFLRGDIEFYPPFIWRS
ncbi:type I-C CRISPR-associated endonuclease Cas1c [Chitinivibrio alkaliphilus]|uniref:CRISPR-associated endonuclease Cas1 n=1 Tax=Chitinivibrio alkaliphilus ACht1 TaxID=1313304 RepID=U7DB64_9BACT|nr:type I-C CRISPR-associated endonuclease Cas1c [Chitinivibrio alkaliphilus]ERP31660.1 CRISPR/Cas system-associated protein Cas1 [Chitinivibrio alkaliphilus ACht1]